MRMAEILNKDAFVGFYATFLLLAVILNLFLLGLVLWPLNRHRAIWPFHKLLRLCPFNKHPAATMQSPKHVTLALVGVSQLLAAFLHHSLVLHLSASRDGVSPPPVTCSTIVTTELSSFLFPTLTRLLVCVIAVNEVMNALTFMLDDVKRMIIVCVMMTSSVVYVLAVLVPVFFFQYLNFATEPCFPGKAILRYTREPSHGKVLTVLSYVLPVIALTAVVTIIVVIHLRNRHQENAKNVSNIPPRVNKSNNGLTDHGFDHHNRGRVQNRPISDYDDAYFQSDDAKANPGKIDSKKVPFPIDVVSACVVVVAGEFLFCVRQFVYWSQAGGDWRVMSTEAWVHLWAADRVLSLLSLCLLPCCFIFDSYIQDAFTCMRKTASKAEAQGPYSVSRDLRVNQASLNSGRGQGRGKSSGSYADVNHWDAGSQSDGVVEDWDDEYQNVRTDDGWKDSFSDYYKNDDQDFHPTNEFANDGRQNCLISNQEEANEVFHKNYQQARKSAYFVNNAVDEKDLSFSPQRKHKERSTHSESQNEEATNSCFDYGMRNRNPSRAESMESPGGQTSPRNAWIHNNSPKQALPGIPRKMAYHNSGGEIPDSDSRSNRVGKRESSPNQPSNQHWIPEYAAPNKIPKSGISPKAGQISSPSLSQEDRHPNNFPNRRNGTDARSLNDEERIYENLVALGRSSTEAYEDQGNRSPGNLYHNPVNSPQQNRIRDEVKYNQALDDTGRPSRPIQNDYGKCFDRERGREVLFIPRGGRGSRDPGLKQSDTQAHDMAFFSKTPGHYSKENQSPHSQSKYGQGKNRGRPGYDRGYQGQLRFDQRDYKYDQDQGRHDQGHPDYVGGHQIHFGYDQGGRNDNENNRISRNNAQKRAIRKERSGHLDHGQKNDRFDSPFHGHHIGEQRFGQTANRSQGQGDYAGEVNGRHPQAYSDSSFANTALDEKGNPFSRRMNDARNYNSERNIAYNAEHLPVKMDQNSGQRGQNDRENQNVYSNARYPYDNDSNKERGVIAFKGGTSSREIYNKIAAESQC